MPFRRINACTPGRFIAGTSLALLLTAPGGALAQANTPAPDGPPANATAPASKVSGPERGEGHGEGPSSDGSGGGGHCTAERTLPGAAATPAGWADSSWCGCWAGYRLALGSQEWELKPQTTFPIELIAHPVLRSDANAVAVGPKW